jgi:hypothetical protein
MTMEVVPHGNNKEQRKGLTIRGSNMYLGITQQTRSNTNNMMN